MRSEVVAYPRRGPLLARLEAWAALSERLQPGPRDLVIDPDTRWTQSGLLPLSDDDGGYRFFPSRAYAADSEQPLAALAADWFSETLGGAPAVPRLYLSEEVRDGGAAARAGLSTPVAVVNFGVGGNLTKRVADPFEAQAVRALLDAGYSVTLDSGFGPEEEERAQRIEAAVGDRRLRLWRGSVAALAGLISGADLYLGYDSAGAHLAAASGVRVIDVFAGAVSERMRSRWRPSGSGRVDVIPVGPHDPPAAPLSVLRGLLR